MHDRASRTTTRVSVTSTGRQITHRWGASVPTISANGRYRRDGAGLRPRPPDAADHPGERLVVAWTPARSTPGRTVRLRTTVRRNKASVRAPRVRNSYAVRVTLRGKLVGKSTVRVR